MQSRMDKYQQKNTTKYERTSKNTKLYEKVYDDIYSDTSYKNMSIIDTAKEINIDKLKNIIDDKYDNKQYRTLKDYSIEDINLDDKPIYSASKKEMYDINKIIDDAKNKRTFIEEAKEKQKYMDAIESRNTKYNKRYDELEKEEKELEELINTMTIPVVNDNESENDLMSDLIGDENTIVTKPVETNFDNTNIEDTKTQEGITNDLKKMDKTFYTDSNMFTKNDFEDFSELKKELGKSHKLKKVIITLIVLAIILGAAYYIYTEYFAK